jgi:hypothetical protein
MGDGNIRDPSTCHATDTRLRSAFPRHAMLLPTRHTTATPLSDIARSLQSRSAKSEQELRSRDGQSLSFKDGPTGHNRCGGRDLHRSLAVRIITTALAKQLVGAGLDAKNADGTAQALVSLVRPPSPGNASAVPLRVRHVTLLVTHAEDAARHTTSAKAYCDSLLTPPQGGAGDKPHSGLRLVIPAASPDNKIIESADFEHRWTVTIEPRGDVPRRAAFDETQGREAKGANHHPSLAGTARTKVTATSERWAIADTGKPDSRRGRIDEAIDAARERGKRLAQELFAALKARAAELTPVGLHALTTPEASDVSLWIRLAEGLCLKRDGAHLCTVAQLRSLSLSDRSSILLALALEAKRAQASAPQRAARAYEMLSYLLVAVTDEDLMPPALRTAEQRFQKLAEADFQRGSSQWAGLSALERQSLLVSLAGHHAKCLAYRVPRLEFADQRGSPVMLALDEGRLPVDTGNAKRWSSFEKMAQRLGQDLMPFWQFELARRFEGGAIDARDVDMARLMCVGNVPPLSAAHLYSHMDRAMATRLDALAPTTRQVALHAPCWMNSLTHQPNATRHKA